MHFIILSLQLGTSVAQWDSESTLRSAGTLLSQVRAPPPAPWPDGGPESLRSPCCGLAVYINQIGPPTLASSHTLKVRDKTEKPNLFIDSRQNTKKGRTS
ncbi:hypothetical protein PoB_005895700 [Plakobranchus ocellatus]|uniref:Secreted protein n=1 Tax=Plakobranchus ocellatus TaxID=259542 RepID=A0AAV4CLE4_9GAST|nr:hypothetical protein PoB_005895700 [Plakobranchus ocellatus]